MVQELKNYTIQLYNQIFFWNGAVDQRKPRHNISVATPSSNHPRADQTHRDSKEKFPTRARVRCESIAQ